MLDLILCGPCGYAENNKDAEKWCTVCEEGLCSDCEKVHKSIKTSRNHMLISTDDYQQIKNISVSLKCKDHDNRLELYCKHHDVAVCLGCVPSQHRLCQEVIPLDKAAENVKRSTELADLEDILIRTLQNIQQIITDRESALQNFEGQRQTIKNTINDTRAGIVKKLDDIEQKLLLELDTQHGKCKFEVDTLLSRLKNSERNLICLRKQTSQLQSFASNIQLFFGIRQINETVFKEVESIKERIKSVHNFEVYLELHPSIIALMKEVDQLGEISVKTTTTSLSFKELKVNQAQVQLLMPEMKSINDVSIKLKKSFEVKQKGFLSLGVTGCTMLSNNNLLMANYYGNSVLMEYSEDGKHILDIPCSRPPFDLTVIDNDRIAVTYGHRKYVEILNMMNNAVERFEFDNTCYGISYQDGKLFIITGGIVIVDIDGNVLKKVNVDCGTYIETTKDRIYFTSKKSQTVTCISMEGEEIWVYKEKSLVKPNGITVDNHQNVYIACLKSKSMIVIQHDGTASKTLIAKTDDLDSSSALHFNKHTDVLLLCTQLRYSALYNLE